jgi:hypothetical protein
MKKLILFSLLLSIISISLYSEATTVTATVQFPDGQVFENGTVQADFTPISGNISVFTYKLNGAAFPYNVSGTMNSSGTFTLTLTDDHVVSPQGGQWKFTVCSNANLPCAISVQDVFGPSIDLSSAINASVITAVGNSFNYPRFYNDTEAALNLGKGIAYYNITSGKVRFYNGSTWADIGGGTTSPLTTKGDIYVFSTVNTRLPVGTDGQCLTANSAQILGLQWGTCGSGSLPTAALGQALVSQGVGVTPVFQQKAIYDVRDWATCDGVADSSITGPNGGVKALVNAIGLQEASIQWIGSTTPSAHCRLENTLFPANISHDFSGGGALEMISSTTTPGNAVFVNGTSAECNGGGGGLLCNTANATNGTTTLSTTASNTLVVSVAPYPGFSFKITSVTDTCGDLFYHVQQSTPGQPRNTGLWVASNIVGGTCTITANANGATTHIQVLIDQFSGMGPVVSPDGQGSCTNADTTTMTSGAASTTVGSLLFGYGGQPFTNETCTAGAGFTQPAGLAGQSTNGFACSQYQLSSTGGSVTANQTITSIPTGSWVYCMQPLKVGNATATILGGINDPDLHQIFFNANGTATQGAIDFTNANILLAVLPEWWGAGTNNTPTVNTPALQAAIWAAFGGGPSPIRNNVSGLNVFNRPLYLTGNYQINDELQFYHVINFKVVCASRLSSGITQTGLNKRILNGQSVAYGSFYDCSWSSSNTSTNAQIDLDFDGSQGNDLRPQFIDFYNNTFLGNGVAAVGVQIAKSGGGAQGSNIYCYDCAAQSFTTAAWQIGTSTANAQNALAIGWYGGDIQGCSQYGIANYGGGFITIYGTTFENGFASQTGYDVLSSASQGPLVMEHVRSESRKIVSANNLYLIDSGNANQAASWAPGASAPVGFIYTGNSVTGDGAYYAVTTDSGGFIGAGTVAAPILASSGTTTSITDTNQTIAGSNTIKIFTVSETITQAVTGSTAIVLIKPTNLATVTGTNGATPITPGETFTQSVTGITAQQVTPTPGVSSSSPLFLTNLNGTADGTHTWVGGTSGAVYTPNAIPTFAASSILVTASTGSPDNSHNWTGGTSGAVFVPTAVPTNTANFTVNAFTGYLVGFLTGTGQNCYGVITSNTATSITYSGGLLTKYPLTSCPAPDATTGFMVEPNWNHGTISSGGMVLQYMNENVIDGAGGVVGVSSGRIQDTGVSGGQVALWGNPRGSVTVSNLQVSRPDWWCCSAGGTPQVAGQNYHKWDVHVLLPGGNSAINWSYPTTGAAQQFTGAIQEDLGSRVLTWMTGTVGTGINVSARPTWIGGRSDQTSANDATRTILEYGGMLGRATAFGTNIAGTDTDIIGGPSTGTALGGAINWWISQTSGSGSTPNSGFKAARINNLGQVESLLSTGTAPFVAASTTPVINLTTVPTTYNAAATQQVNTHIVEDTKTLSSGTPSTATVTLLGAAAFTSNTTYQCTVSNLTTPANGLGISYTDGSHFVVTGPNTVADNFSFICVGK